MFKLILEQFLFFFSEKMLTPPKNKKFMCDVCNKSYKHKNHLNSHIKFECLNPLQFQCPNCLRRFARRYFLKVHINNGKCSRR